MDLFCDAREVMQRYDGHVGELRRLFVFHGLTCGHTESFAALGAKLAESKAFRTDLSAISRNIRDQEHGSMSSEEMLTVIALAIGGEDLVEGRSPALGLRNAVVVLWVLLDAVGGWRESHAGSRSHVPAESAALRSERSEVSATRPELDPSDAVRTETQRAVNLRSVEGLPLAPAVRLESGPGAEVMAETRDRVEVAIRELKVYLEDIDRRIGRLEPHVEDLSQSVHASEEKLQRLEREQPEEVTAEGMDGERSWQSAPNESISANGSSGTPRGLYRYGVAQALAQQTEPNGAGEEHETGGREAIYDDPGDAPTENAADVAVLSFSEAEPPEEAGIATVEEAPERWRWAPEATATEESVEETEPGDDWRRRVGAGLRIAALLFAIAGVAGLFYMLHSPRAEDVASSKHVSAVAPAPTQPTEAKQPTRDATAGDNSAETVPDVKLAKNAAPAAMGAPAATIAQKEQEDVRRAPQASSEVSSRAAKSLAPLTTARKDVGTQRENAEAKQKAPQGPGAAFRIQTGVAPASAPAPAAKRVTPPAPSASSAGTLVAAKDSGTSPAAPDGERPVVEIRSAGGTIVTAKRPVYPAEALRAHTEATVVLNAFLAKDGSVRRMDVVKGAYGFNRSAMDAVWGWKYKPQVVHGQPVEMEAQITVDYRLH